MVHMYGRLINLLAKINKKELLAVAAFFFIVTSLLTQGIVLNIDTELYTDGVGDATSGFLWLLYANHDWGYFTSHTQLVNYPFGENLWSPIYITWTLILAPLWLLSHFVSPVAAINIMMYVGFMTGGIAGYYAVKHYTNNWAISLFGGYAMAFVPYHMMKGVDHFTNIFSWVFVAIFVSFLLFWKKQTVFRGVALAFSVAAACYTDGYFVLLAAVMLGALYVAGVVADLVSGDGWRAAVRKSIYLLGVGIISLVLMMPILYTLVGSQKQIQSDLSNSRGDVAKEITYYASKPIDFLLPVSKNITVGQHDWYKDLLAQKNSRSNDGENSTYIGYTVLALYIVAVGVAIKAVVRRVNNKPLGVDRGLLITVLAVPLMLVWMVQPVVHIAGVTLHMPSYLLAEHVQYWRVLSRIFIALHPLIVFAACLGLAHILKGKSKQVLYVLVAVLFSVLCIEYYVSKATFGYDDMPKAYEWLATQKNIRVVAEVPIIDRPIEVAGYAVYAQMIHGKPLINSALAKGPIGLLNPLGTVSNPETVNFIRDRGADAIILHARECAQYEWGKLVYQEQDAYSPQWIDKAATSICIYKLNSTSTMDHFYVNAIDGFAKTNYLDNKGEYWLALEKSTGIIDITDAEGNVPTKNTASDALLTAELGTIGEYATKVYAWRVSQKDQVIASGDTLVSNAISLHVDPAAPVLITATLLDGGPIGKGEVGLTAIEVK